MFFLLNDICWKILTFNGLYKLIYTLIQNKLLIMRSSLLNMIRIVLSNPFCGSFDLNKFSQTIIRLQKTHAWKDTFQLFSFEENILLSNIEVSNFNFQG